MSGKSARSRPLIAVVFRKQWIGFSIYVSGLGLADHGVTTRLKDPIEAAKDFFQKRLARYPRCTTIFEALEDLSRHSPDNRKTVRELKQILSKQGFQLMDTKRAVVRETLGLPKRSSREDIAKEVALAFPSLRIHRLPHRKIWRTEERSLPVYLAASLLIPHLGSLG